MIRGLAIFLLCACVLLFVGGLAFRLFIYHRLQVTPGDAYGIADVIEVYLALLLMIVALTGFVFGLVLVLWRRLALVTLGVALLALTPAAALSYLPLYHFILMQR